MPELLDVLDENGNPTGEIKPRDVVHSAGLWHRTAHVYVFRKKDEGLELLIQRRSLKKDISPGKWDTRFGGHPKSGETTDQAAVKELREETGLSVPINNLIRGETYKNVGSHRAFPTNYYYRFNGNLGALSFNDGEVEEVKWMKTDDIVSAMQAEPEKWVSHPDRIKKVLAELKRMLS